VQLEEQPQWLVIGKQLLESLLDSWIGHKGWKSVERKASSSSIHRLPPQGCR
jgi:hypothetical protein